MKTIVIKLGTQAILSTKGTILLDVVAKLVEQIAKLQNGGARVVLVSSGAVGSGRGIVRELFGREYGSSMVEKQLLASIGQPELMHTYSSMFKKYKLLAAQVLLTRQDFRTRQHYLNIGHLLREIMQRGNIVPIINENDSVAIEELMFTDNDELAGLLAAQLDADKLILLSSVPGVYDGNPEDPASTLISVMDANEKWQSVATTKSMLGRGGMHSKLAIARKMANLGITTHIAAATTPNIIFKIMRGESIGTTVLPLKKKSSAKRWIAFSSVQNSGSVHINACLHKIIAQKKNVTSILPVGIEKFNGEFKKGDMINIMAPNGKKIGVGVARYSSDKLAEYCGKQHKPLFIHYDRMYID